MDPNTEELNDPKPKEGATQKYLKNRFVITTPDPVPQMPTQQYKKAEDPKTAKNFEPTQHETNKQEPKRTSDSKLSEVEAYPRPTNMMLPIKRGGIKHFSKPRGANAPLSTSFYTSLDDGNAPCRFSRPTCTAISIDSAFYSKSMFPLGILYTPLAELGEDEQEIPLIDSGMVVTRKNYPMHQV